jgi:hypothetical protein
MATLEAWSNITSGLPDVSKNQLTKNKLQHLVTIGPQKHLSTSLQV